jgi:hypothetical protein
VLGSRKGKRLRGRESETKAMGYEIEKKRLKDTE